MSEILTLAAKFKTQSQQQVQTIEQEVQSAMTQLNSFMTAKLQESETIIKQGITNLDTSNEQLLKILLKNQTDMSTALETYMSSAQAHINQTLVSQLKSTTTMLENYTQRMEQLINQRENRIVQIMKSELRNWLGGAILIGFLILCSGIVLGTFLVNKLNT